MVASFFPFLLLFLCCDAQNGGIEPSAGGCPEGHYFNAAKQWLFFAQWLAHINPSIFQFFQSASRLICTICENCGALPSDGSHYQLPEILDILINGASAVYKNTFPPDAIPYGIVSACISAFYKYILSCFNCMPPLRIGDQVIPSSLANGGDTALWLVPRVLV